MKVNCQETVEFKVAAMAIVNYTNAFEVIEKRTTLFSSR